MRSVFAATTILWTGCAGPHTTAIDALLETPAVHEDRVSPEPSTSLLGLAPVPAAPPAPPPPAPPPPAPPPPAPPPIAPEPAILPPPPGTAVLHVGDSFVHAGLTQRLRQLFEPLGVRYEVRAEQSSITLDWAKRIPAEIARTQPNLVIITLGANEIGSQYLDVQARAIRRIVRALGSRPCVWTTPPLWMEESGFFDVLQANLSPCRFYETDRQLCTFLPRRDKVHPTMEGGAVWAEKLFEYLMDERTGDAQQPWMLMPSPDDELAPRGRRTPLPYTASPCDVDDCRQ